MTRLEIITSFSSRVCPHCDNMKRAAMSFCGRCYNVLPLPMRLALHHRFDQGYEEAFESALNHLAAKAKAAEEACE